jgi:hypothetical protein
LSVTFVTFSVGLNGFSGTGFLKLQKVAIVLHSLSIIFGLLMQLILIYKPINDIKRAYNEVNEVRKFDFGVRHPSIWQRVCFLGQVVSFFIAFFSIVVSVLI